MILLLLLVLIVVILLSALDAVFVVIIRLLPIAAIIAAIAVTIWFVKLYATDTKKEENTHIPKQKDENRSLLDKLSDKLLDKADKWIAEHDQGGEIGDAGSQEPVAENEPLTISAGKDSANVDKKEGSSQTITASEDEKDTTEGAEEDDNCQTKGSFLQTVIGAFYIEEKLGTASKDEKDEHDIHSDENREAKLITQQLTVNPGDENHKKTPWGTYILVFSIIVLPVWAIAWLLWPLFKAAW